MLIRCNMAISAKKGKNRVIKKVLHYFIFVNIVSQLVPCRGSIELQGKAFMNGAKDELFNSGRPFQESFRYESPSYNSDIFFNPPFMDYGSRSIGMPFVQQITVHNTNSQLSLHLLSISGSSPHFHCSFFEDKLVAPMGNTSFEICFLAQNLGQIKSTLYIHSSRGSFKYHVSGEGTHNPYRIRPVLGARVPINSSFSPVIHLYNPHESVLQVQEIYSSGSDLHLELPSGQVEATKDMWEIPPYETKPIMKANFLGRVENNHTVFIRIKTNKESREEMLVVPVEVEVTSSPGLFSLTELLDFGVLRSFDESSSLKLEVINSRSQTILITNITVEPLNEAIEIDFVQLEVKNDIFNPTSAALISFQALKAISLDECSGHIVLWSSGLTQELKIPYQAHVIFGDLQYNKSLYFYSSNAVRDVSHDFSIKNLFQHPVVIFNVTLNPEAEDVFTILNFSKSVLITPLEELMLMTIIFHPKKPSLHFNTEIFLHTNLSTFPVSLVVYNGKLQVYSKSNYMGGHLNFGTLSIGESRSLNFTLLNDNPDNVVISKFFTNFAGATVDLIYVGPKNIHDVEENMLEDLCSSKSLCPVLLKGYHKAHFRLHVRAPRSEGSYSAEVIIETDSEPLLSTTFNLQTTTGNILIDPSRLIFHQCFPGRVTWLDLHVNSSFQKDIKLQDISFIDDDQRFKFIPRDDQSVTLAPNEESLVGRLSFDPLRGSLQGCYLPLNRDLSAETSWLHGLALSKSVVEIDILLFSRSRHKWKSMTPLEKISNITMQLNTDHVKGFLFNVQAHFYWPTLLNQSKIVFPLTPIGNYTENCFTIGNPSNYPLLVHIVPDSIYPDVQLFLTSLGTHQFSTKEFSSNDSRSTGTQINSTSTNPFTFFIMDADSLEPTPVEDQISGIRVFPNTSAILLKPGLKVSVRLTFHPTDEALRSSTLIIRNNLTAIELVKIQGQGGREDLRLSNRKPGSLTPLSFEMSDKHMKMCEKNIGQKNVQPNFSIKRTFTLQNLGQLSATISSFEISGETCEGHGFKILDCYPLTLHANENKKLNIVFTPDFSLSKIRHILTIRSNLMMEMEFVLQVNIPSHMISKCSASIPRPMWEPVMFYCIIVLMGFVVVCVVMAAYYESNQIISNELQWIRNEQLEGYYDKSKVFDLRLCASNDAPKCFNRKLTLQESYSNPLIETKAVQSNSLTASQNKSSVVQKLSKLFISFTSLFSDIGQSLKFSLFSDHKKPCIQEVKKKNDNSKFSNYLFNIFETKKSEKVHNSKNEDLYTVQGKNSCLLQQKTETDSNLILRKNKRHKQLMTNNHKSPDLPLESEEKVTLRNKNDVGSRSSKQESRKGLLGEAKLQDKNDDSSSTTTDTSSLENDDKVVLTEFRQAKKEKNKGNSHNLKKCSNTNQDVGRVETSHSPKRKLSRDAEESAKTRIFLKNEGTKTKASANPSRGKRKTNAAGLSSQIKTRQQSKSPIPTWDSPSADGDDLTVIVNQTSNFAKLKNASADKPSKNGHLSNKPLEAARSPSKSVKISTNATNEVSPFATSSNFGGRPVAAVGATVRRSWNPLETSGQHYIGQTFKGTSNTSIQAISPIHNSYLASAHLLNCSASKPDFLTNSKDFLHSDYAEPMNNLKPSLEKRNVMMQTLLAERRKRLSEYQKKMLISEWPGKNATQTHQPWNDYSGYWPSQSCINNGMGCMSPLTPRYDMFGPSPWLNNNFASSSPPPAPHPPMFEDNLWLSSAAATWRSPESLKLGTQDNESYAIFDPFNTLENNGSIWNPTSTGSNVNNGWDMSSSPTKPSSEDK